MSYIPLLRKIVVLSFLILLLLAGSTLFLDAEDKDFYFPEVRIDVRIQKDGSFIVDEFRTYEFQGSFSWAMMWIPLRVSRKGYQYDIQIEDFSILNEQGHKMRSKIKRNNGKLEATWYYSARNEKRTFHFHYRIKGGIFNYPEVSELYWQIIGDGWDKPARFVEILVHLPEAVSSPDQILIYGHGPLSGKSEIVDQKTARFTASNLNSGQYVEIRVAWPAGMVSGLISKRHTYDSIRLEEAGFVQETIDKAKKAKEQAKRSKDRIIFWIKIWLILLILGSLAWLVIYFRIWKKIGKDYRFSDTPDYYRELPSNLPPALVEVLLKEGESITPRSFAATFFDMARRGYIEFEDRIVEKKGILGKKQDYDSKVTLKKDFSEDDSLVPYEKKLMRYLFNRFGNKKSQVGSEFTLEFMKKYMKTSPQYFQKWYRAWGKQIKNIGKKKKFIEPKSLKTRNLFIAGTIPAIILTANPIIAVLAAIFIQKIKRRSKNWAWENELWKALQRFLDDFSNFKKIPPEAYKLWEHYLVFGILFGNAKKIIKMLPRILENEQAAVPVWYAGYATAGFLTSGGINSMIRSIESMSTSIVQASTNAANYSSGGGGGFSSGGGGGGGGGGGTAG